AAKAAADAKKKAAAEKAAAAEGVDDLLGDLSSGKNAPKTGGAKGNGQPSKDSGTSGANGGATGADISAYAKQIQVAIQSRLYDASLYQGKQCVLHISLAPDGSLKSITSEGGDPALCQAALMAAKTAKIPKPPSQAVYEKIKDAKLDFKL
ncbi:cell envelope integrity protein TolA, partial [Salmonella enterica]